MPPAHRFRDALDVARNILPFTSYPYRGQPVTCPVCEDVSSTSVSNIDRRLKRLPTVACDRCGLLYTNPMPCDDDLERYYRRLYRLDYQMVLAPSARHLRKRNAEAARRAEIVAGLLPRSARTLDFGAGSGEFVLAMHERGFDAYGFEPGESYASHARNLLGERIRSSRWQDVTYDAEFDLVTSFHVLEHLRDPLAALKAIALWVKPGGIVHIEVPDALGQLRKKGFGSLHFAHLVGFNRHNLEFAAALAGLQAFQIIGPTEMLFRRPERPIETETSPTPGGVLSRAALGDRQPVHAYLAHHGAKVLRGFRLRSGKAAETELRN